LTENPLISVVMPVYNGAKTVLAAVESILRQTYSPIELIVVDDGSTDRTAEILASVKDARMRVIAAPGRKGVGAARQWGLEHARGEYIAVQDADDIAYPGRLATQVAYMRENHLALCGTWAYLVTPDGKKREMVQAVESDVIKRTILRSNMFVHSTVLFEKKAAESVGGYVGSIGEEDYDLWVRLIARYRAGNVPEFLLDYTAPNTTFRYLLREQKATVRVRWCAIFKHGYPWWNILFVFTPFLGIWIPKRIKMSVKKTLLACRLKRRTDAGKAR
jgi:glycosyltransferase involved in cell wall biosynthesis